MPYAKITLTCSTCGNDFEHRHKCSKSRDIDSYIDWAKSNITTCPECYAKMTREAEKNHMLEKDVTITLKNIRRSNPWKYTTLMTLNPISVRS